MAIIPSSRVIGYRPIEEDLASDVAQLRAQRVACGWDEDLVEYNLEQARLGNAIYWFFIALDDESNGSTTTQMKRVHRRDDELVIGSGGIDLSGIQNGTSMASLDRKEFCLMGIFLWPEYRGASLFRRMTEALMVYGFEDLDFRSATVMTLKANPVTNGLFKKLGFQVYLEEAKPEWRAENAYGWSHRVTKEQFMQALGRS